MFGFKPSTPSKRTLVIPFRTDPLSLQHRPFGDNSGLVIGASGLIQVATASNHRASDLRFGPSNSVERRGRFGAKCTSITGFMPSAFPTATLFTVTAAGPILPFPWS